MSFVRALTCTGYDRNKALNKSRCEVILLQSTMTSWIALLIVIDAGNEQLAADQIIARRATPVDRGIGTSVARFVLKQHHAWSLIPLALFSFAIADLTRQPHLACELNLH